MSSQSTYKTLTLTPIAPYALRVIISSPPTNLLTHALLSDIHTFLTTLSTSESLSTRPKVVVLASANQDFWINHLDLRVVSSRHPLPSPSPEPSALRLLGAIINALDTLPIIFISEIDGRAIGGGNELAVHTDLRYLGPSALFGIPEVAGGLVHGGGLHRMISMIGPARALEWNLRAQGCPPHEAVEIGWANAAFGTAEALRECVDELAKRIAKWPRGGIEGTKSSVQEAMNGESSLGKDMQRLGELVETEAAQGAITRILERGQFGERNEFELGLPDSMVELW